MKNLVECPVHVYPTEKTEFPLFFHKLRKNLVSYEDFENIVLSKGIGIISPVNFYNPRHVCILSNFDNIEIGDYFVMDSLLPTAPVKCIGFEKEVNILHETGGCHFFHTKKVISSSDESLGLPLPSAKFMKNLVKTYKKATAPNAMVEYIPSDISVETGHTVYVVDEKTISAHIPSFIGNIERWFEKNVSKLWHYLSK